VVADRSLALALEVEAPVDVESLFSSLQAGIARETGWRAWLVSRPTWQRRALVLSSAAPSALVVLGLLGFRKDLDRLASWRLALDLGLLGTLILANAWTALRPVQESPWPIWKLIALGLGSALTAALFALLPPGHVGLPTLADGPGAPAFLCYAVGMNVGLPIVLVAWLVGREASPWRTLLAGATGGVTGVLVLHLSCASPVREHLLYGHATIPLSFLAVAGVAAVRRAKARSGSS
jgi:hypothetical protein